VAWCQWDAPPSLWDLNSGKEIALANVGQSEVVGVAFTNSGQRLLGALWRDGELSVRDLVTGEQLLTLPRTERTVTQAVWTADTRRFVALEDRRYVRLWDTATGRLLGEFEHQPAVRRVVFSADGNILALGGIEGRFSVWDVQKRQRLMSTTGHAANIHGLALSPDGKRLVSSAADSTAKLWDTRSGHEVLALRTHLHENSLLAFSPNGEQIVSVNVDNRLQIWSAGGVEVKP
jgi:WD40 repeat protein